MQRTYSSFLAPMAFAVTGEKKHISSVLYLNKHFLHLVFNLKQQQKKPNDLTLKGYL